MTKGSKHSKSAKEKNRLAHLGKLLGEKNPSKRTKVRQKIRQSKLGRKWPQKVKNKISKSRLGQKWSRTQRRKQSGKNSSFWKGGKPQCIECGKQLTTYGAKKCVRCAHKGMNMREKHWNWKDGITPENNKIRNSIEYNLWRNSVYARDNWICQKYGIRGGKLIAHHIQNFAKWPELRFAIDNGITLSDKAHREFHKKYGRKNNTKEQMLEFLTSKI